MGSLGTGIRKPATTVYARKITHRIFHHEADNMSFFIGLYRVKINRAKDMEIIDNRGLQ